MYLPVSFRSVSNLLRRRVRFDRSAADLLLRRIQAPQEPFLPQSLSNHHTEVSLLRRVPGVAPPSRVLHPTRIGSALGLLSHVSVLSVAHDVCVTSCLLLGGGDLKTFAVLIIFI